MIEAHGVKGMKNAQWRKTFKTVAELNRWVEKNDAEVRGTRPTEGSVLEYREDVFCACGGRINVSSGECHECDDPQVWGA